MQQTFQTNGILLDDAWCAFFKEHDFLVGLSVDGPRELHDTYRLDRQGGGHVRPRHAGLAASAPARRRVQHPVHGQRGQREARPRRSIAFFATNSARNGCSSFRSSSARRAETLAIANQGWSERRGGKRLLYTQTGDLVTEPLGRAASNTAGSSIDVFEEWVRRDVGKVYRPDVRRDAGGLFRPPLLCIHAPTCGYGPALEYNGDVYTCDHFVEPGQKLGNILETPHADLVASPQMRKFGDDKRDTLTAQCRKCEVRSLCNGGCPKDRFALSRDGEPGHNYLCAGLELFFTHTAPAMRVMAQLLQRGRPPADVMRLDRPPRTPSADPIRHALAAAARNSGSATATRRRAFARTRQRVRRPDKDGHKQADLAAGRWLWPQAICRFAESG